MFGDKKREAAQALNDFKTWAAERAIHLDLAASPEDNARKLEVLNPMLSGKRLAFIGEPDHFIHEKYPYRHLVLEYLAARGFTRVGEELSRTDGVRIDNFIATGDGSHLDRIATYGYRGGLRSDRDDTPTGVLKDAYSDKYPVEHFRAEQIRFAQAARETSQRVARMRFFGFDVDALPGCAYEDLHAILEPVRADSLVDSMLTALTRVPGESIDDEIRRLDTVVATFTSEREYLPIVLGIGVAREAAYIAEWLRDSFTYLRSIIPISRWEDLNPAMAHRELMMHREVMSQLESAGVDEKIALLSHNVHLCRDMSAIAGMTAAAGPGGKSAPPLGDFLSRRFPNAVFSIWMLIGKGRDRQTMTPLTDRIELVPGTLNATLAEIGECFVLPIDRADRRARMLQTPTRMMMDGNSSVTTPAAAQADAIFFIREVTPISA